MASTGKGREKWPSGAEASATGGHLSPDLDTDEFFLESLRETDARAAARRSTPRPRTSKGRTTTPPAGATPAASRPVPRAAEPGSISPLEAPQAGLRQVRPNPPSPGAEEFAEQPLERRPPPRTRSRRGATRARVPIRRVRRTVKHVDPLSVLKLSLFFYTVVLMVWLLIVAILYNVVSAAGLFEWIEGVGRSFTLWENVNISLLMVERWALLIGLAGVVIASLVNLALAFAYNLGADLVGGLEVTFVEKEL